MKLFVTLIVAGLLGPQGPMASQHSNSATHEHRRSNPWQSLFAVKPPPTAEGQSVNRSAVALTGRRTAAASPARTRPLQHANRAG